MCTTLQEKNYLNVMNRASQIRVDFVCLRLVRVRIRVIVSFYDQRVDPLVLPIDEATCFNLWHLRYAFGLASALRRGRIMSYWCGSKHLRTHRGGIDSSFNTQPMTHLDRESPVHIEGIYDDHSSGGGDLRGVAGGIRIQIGRGVGHSAAKTWKPHLRHQVSEMT